MRIKTLAAAGMLAAWTFIIGLTVAATPVSAQAAGLRDVPETHWGAGNIQRALEQGIVDGYPDGTFKPEQQVEQAEFLVMLIRAYKPDELAAGGQTADWRTPYLTYAKSMNWHLIDSDSSVVLSRGNVARLLAGAAGKAYDIDTSISYLLGIGLVEGRTEPYPIGFHPDEPVTRAEAVTFVQRFKAYFPQLQSVSTGGLQPNEMDPLTAKVGDQVAGWTIASIETTLYEDGALMSAIVNFEPREVTVSGFYQNMPDGSEFFDGIIFTPDAASDQVIPKLRIGQHTVGDRFLFRSEEAEAAFLPQGSKGKATIVISGFSYHYWPKDDYRDNTTFVKLVEIDKATP
ncbi:S-layer homology domain-containing protein [Paenibacillus chartarius]|uniref:S-layer homology domain-containing protein n=1 Tax=Paenibacillus chartarius TaxID=747481 RepID=A0ABV6DPA5_9BACL